MVLVLHCTIVCYFTLSCLLRYIFFLDTEVLSMIPFSISLLFVYLSFVLPSFFLLPSILRIFFLTIGVQGRWRAKQNNQNFMFSHVPLASPNSISEIAPEINCFTVLKNTIKQSRKQTTITTTFVTEDLYYKQQPCCFSISSLRFDSIQVSCT